MQSRFGTGNLSADLLESMPLFSGLSPAELDRVKGYLHARAFPAGASIITADQPGELAYIILGGTVKIHVEQPDGSDMILAILGPGEVLGEMSLVDQVGRSASATTMEECKLAWLDRDSFRDCMSAVPRMTQNLIFLLSRRLRLANAHMQVLAAEGVPGRVAHQIVAFTYEYGEPAREGGTRIVVRLTQGDLAALVGATRVRVNQVLTGFKDCGYLSIDSEHHITVHDREALARCCGA